MNYAEPINAGHDDAGSRRLYVRPIVRPRRSPRLEPGDAPLPLALTIAAIVYAIFAAPLTCYFITTPMEFLANLVVLLLVVTLPLSTLVCGIVYLVRDSLRLRSDDCCAGAQVGAWTTLIMCASTWCLIHGNLSSFSSLPTSEMWVQILLGPVIATPLAQYVGALSQRSGGIRSELPTKRQFGIFQVLVLTAWVALALALLKLMNLLHPVSLMYLGGWILYQSVTLWVVRMICERGESPRF